MGSLLLCEIQNGQLTVPATVRQQYLSDPVRASEWRKFMAEFDRKWCATSPASVETAGPRVAEGEPDGAGGGEFTWSQVFSDEPSTKSDLESRYGAAATSFAIADGLHGYVVEGPKLFLVSTGVVEWDTTTPIISYGAGTWLLEAKAEQFWQDGHDIMIFHFYLRGEQPQRLQVPHSE